MSEQIGELAAALAKAQGAMKAAAKDRENPYFKSHYATLASVFDAIREPFAANGLAVVQPTRVDEHGQVCVTTAILHSSGQWISGEATAKPVKSDPQGVGSLISYLKRYGLQAMVGVASADEDDDGNAATHPPGKPFDLKKQTLKEVPPPPGPPSDRGEPYDPSNERDKRTLWDTLKKRGFTAGDSGQISALMKGKYIDELDATIKSFKTSKQGTAQQ